MRFTIYQESRRGGRGANEDRVAYCYSREALLMVLADGMGGHRHGEVASRIAVQRMTEAFRREAAPRLREPERFLPGALSDAHCAIRDWAREPDEAPRTTCVACLVQEGGAWWAHAGDSRLYVVRDGRVLARTRDHSRVQLMVEQGLLDARSALAHPARNRIYSCLGGEQAPRIDFSPRLALCAGDRILLCSDGAWAPLGDELLPQALQQGPLMAALPRLLDEAERLAGAQADNLSAIGMAWEEASPGAGEISTCTLPAHAVRSEGCRREARPADELSDEQIEAAVDEIRSAISNHSK